MRRQSRQVAAWVALVILVVGLSIVPAAEAALLEALHCALSPQGATSMVDSGSLWSGLMARTVGQGTAVVVEIVAALVAIPWLIAVLALFAAVQVRAPRFRRG